MKLVRSLSVETGFSEIEVRRILKTASYRYKTYYIEKRHGGKRLIEQPTPEVKRCQRWAARNIIYKLPRHEAATAYIRRMSILSNASAHKEGKYLLKMDFKNFFPSITALDFRRHLAAHWKLEVESDEVDLLSRLLFRKTDDGLRLTIGAPSSPPLANTIMFEFDSLLQSACSERKITYTRYADDLSFTASKRDTLMSTVALVNGICGSIAYPRLAINSKKTVFVSPKYRRTITGLVLTTKGSVSLGRERKRRLSAAVHSALNGKLDQLEVAQLKGNLAFAWSIEKEFLFRLIRKYGSGSLSPLVPEIAIRMFADQLPEQAPWQSEQDRGQVL
ncbi:MAG: retron St85 family RNA-directed DNA polymerase [Thiohalocapsa sp.]